MAKVYKIPQQFTQKLTTGQIEKAAQVAKSLNIELVWLLGVFYFETAKTFSTSITNQIGSVGLIQFTRDAHGLNYKTIKGVKYPLSSIAQMDWNDQLDLVQKYYEEAIGSKKINSFEDLYLATFFPVAVGKPNDYTLQTKTLSASLIANQNPAFDTNKDNRIEKGEVTKYFRSLFGNNGIDYDYYFENTTVSATTIIILCLGFFLSSAGVIITNTLTF